MEKIRNFTPAITNMSKEVLGIGGTQFPYFRTEEFDNKLKENEKLLLDLIDCKNGRVVFLTASGTGAMDSVLSNLVSSQDRILVINGGSFGQKWCDICSFYKLDYKNYEPGFGKNISLDKLEELIKSLKVTVILMQATETSSGQLFSVKEVGKLSKKYGTILVVDAISSFAIDEYKMESWNVNVTILSTQKGLQLFPGMSLVVLDEQALKKGMKPTNYYMDYSKYLKDWKDVAQPFTPNVQVIHQLNYRLKEIKKQGIGASIQRANDRAIRFRQLVKNLPMKVVAENPSNCITSFQTERNDIKKFFKHLISKNIYITPYTESRFNVSHIGELNIEDDKLLCGEIEKWLKRK